MVPSPSRADAPDGGSAPEPARVIEPEGAREPGGAQRLGLGGRDGVLLAGALVVLCVALFATMVPAAFTADENNYLTTVVALREGGLTLPWTAGLSPAFELYFFDPSPGSRGVPTTPIGSTAPPLYAPLALPFSYFGWEGLVALNVLSFAAIAAAVFAYVARHASRRSSPWIAAAAFTLGGYSLEYAQGMWPQMLAAALGTAGFVLAAHAREGGRRALGAAAAAGLALGLATGVRYQNLVLAAAIGATLFLSGRRRLAACGAFAAGIALPLLACSLVNHARLGTFNPVTKGPGYANVAGMASAARSLTTPLHVFWAKVVDFSQHPPIGGAGGAAWAPEPETGAFLLFGAVKKAWLQSSPWLLVALVAIAIALRPRRERRPGAPGEAGATKDDPGASSSAAHAIELRAIAVPIALVLGLFAYQGFGRTDGLGFNQRYFLELVPLGAAALGLAVDRVPLRAPPLAVGAVVTGALAAAVAAMRPEAALRQLAILYAPLALAVALAGAWALSLRPEGRAAAAGARLAALLLGACLSWALVVHVGDDVRTARSLRLYNRARQEMLAAVLPPRAALVCHGHTKDAVGPLLLDRELVVLDTGYGGGRAAPKLVGELLAQRRRVFVDTTELPPRLLRNLLAEHDARPLADGLPVIEVLARTAEERDAVP